MLGFKINYKFFLPIKFGRNNNINRNEGSTMKEDEYRFWIKVYVWWKTLLITSLVMSACCNSGCASPGDDDNCAVHCTPGPDAGPTADADQTQPDASTTPDGSNADVCADYAGVPSDGWQCNPNDGNPSFDINNLTMVDEGGVCKLHSQQIWCQDTPPASDVLAGHFSCTDINGGYDTCWHN